MARLKRKKKLSQSLYLGFYQLSALVVGWRDPLKYPFIPREQLGFLTRAELKKAWEYHKENPRVSQHLDPTADEYRPGRRPWAWWEFEAFEPRDRSVKQHVQLERMGELAKHELIHLARHQARKRKESFQPPEPLEGFMPMPQPAPLSAENQDMVNRATKQVSREKWFPLVAQSNGQLSIADADAVLNQSCTVEPERGWYVVDFIESFCKLDQGEWAGEFIELADWQVQKFLLPLFSWVRPDGTRRFRRAGLWIAKKNGKSTLCSALNVFLAVGDGEGGPKVFNAALSREQAEEVYGPCTGMIAASPELARILKPVDSKREVVLSAEYNVGAVHRKRRQFVIKVLAAEARTSQGKNIHAVIKDELHVWKDAKYFASLKFGGSARRQWLDIAISTMGDDLDGLGGAEYAKCKKLLAGEVFDYTYFAVVFEPPPDLDYDDPRVYLNPAFWFMANPSLGVTIDPRGFYDELQACRAGSPSDWAEFLRYKFNLWREGGEPFLSMPCWYDCGKVLFAESELYGRDCYGGLDLAQVEDTAGLVWCFPDLDAKPAQYRFVWRCFVPEDVAKQRDIDGDPRYLNWISNGYLIGTPGARIDYKIVAEHILRDSQVFHVRQLAVDPANAEFLRQEVEGYGIEIFIFGQSHKNYTYAMRQYKDLISAGLIKHGNNPVATWQARNVVAHENALGGIMPRKKFGNKRFKIDLHQAAIMGLDGSLRDEYATGSKYAQDDWEIAHTK